MCFPTCSKILRFSQLGQVFIARGTDHSSGLSICLFHVTVGGKGVDVEVEDGVVDDSLWNCAHKCCGESSIQSPLTKELLEVPHKTLPRRKQQAATPWNTVRALKNTKFWMRIIKVLAFLMFPFQSTNKQDTKDQTNLYVHLRRESTGN